MKPERPSLVESMQKHSSDLWVLLHDARGCLRAVPIYEDVSYRELVVRNMMILRETHVRDGIWTYRPSREEAEWRADLELDARRGAPGMQAYPFALGTFAPRRRLILEESEIHAMFGQAAAA